MKLKSKGKVYPSPSSSSSGEDYLSILKLLPAAIWVLASVLPFGDREVLAYMITRSLKTTTTSTINDDNNNPSLISQDCSSKKRSSKKHSSAAAKLTQKGGGSYHKPPVFDCDCFDCYTCYWFRWDSSPKRDLIHEVIEAFEDHLTSREAQKPSKKNSRLKRRDCNSRTVTRVPDNPVFDLPVQPEQEVPVLKSSTADEPPIFADDAISTEKDVEEELAEVAEMTEEFPVVEDAVVEVRSAAAATTTISNHKGLARKVLPDVLGLLNSRLWGLWNPNV